MKLIDRTLKAIGLRRASNSTAYRGAEVSRLFWDWVVAPTKADDEIRGDLARLRARGRVVDAGRLLTVCAADVWAVDGSGKERLCATLLATARNIDTGAPRPPRG